MIVDLDDISPFLREAVVVTEEHTFYTLAGSAWAIVRAVFIHVHEGEPAQGGSTLTQQYVRNAFASVGRLRSFLRNAVGVGDGVT